MPGDRLLQAALGAALGATIGAASALAQANITVREFSLTPATPVQGQPVRVRINVYNTGNRRAGPYRVEWWPGENYTAPGCAWNVPGANPRGGRILQCTYAGYPSWYARLVTKVVADSGRAVAETNEADNVRRRTIRVARPGGSAGSATTAGRPNIVVRSLSLTPSTPVQGRAVQVRINVYNAGNAPAGPFRVEWWPGENYTAPGCAWNVPGANARGGRILRCAYAGYPSWYARLVTKVVADSGRAVAETNEADNVRRMRIQVRRAP